MSFCKKLILTGCCAVAAANVAFGTPPWGVFTGTMLGLMVILVAIEGVAQ